jgi:sugar/nucleoside kinase (ribokinase family)
MVGYDGKVEEIMAEPVQEPAYFAGVGSAFCGGFLHSVASGLDPFKSARIATCVAAKKLAQPGGSAGLPSPESISHLL